MRRIFLVMAMGALVAVAAGCSSGGPYSGPKDNSQTGPGVYAKNIAACKAYETAMADVEQVLGEVADGQADPLADQRLREGATGVEAAAVAASGNVAESMSAVAIALGSLQIALDTSGAAGSGPQLAAVAHAAATVQNVCESAKTARS